MCVCVCTARRIDLLLVRRGGRLVEVDWDRPVDRGLQWKPHCCVVAFPVCSRNCTLIKLPSSTYIIVSFLTSFSLSFILCFYSTRLWKSLVLQKKKKKRTVQDLRDAKIFFSTPNNFQREMGIKNSAGKNGEKTLPVLFFIYPDISIGCRDIRTRSVHNGLRYGRTLWMESMTWIFPGNEYRVLLGIASVACLESLWNRLAGIRTEIVND